MDRPCLTLVDVAILSDTAFKRVVDERDVGQNFQSSNAHNTGSFNANHVRHKPGVENTHGPHVENRPPRRLCQINGIQIQGKAPTSVCITQYMHALRKSNVRFTSQQGCGGTDN